PPRATAARARHQVPQERGDPAPPPGGAMRYGVVRKVLVAGAAADEVRGSGADQSGREVGLHLVQRHALLGHRVALADRDGLVLGGLEVDGEAERGADLVLSAVAA